MKTPTKTLQSAARSGFTALMVVVLLSLTASCATRSRLLSSWELPSNEIGPFEKLAVVAMTRHDQENRTFELAATNEIESHGIDAFPGYSVLDNGELSLAEMEQQLNSTGADGILMFKVIGIDENYNYVPPTLYTTAGAPYPHWWNDPYWGYYTPYPYHYWGYWYPAVQVTRSPGYWRKYKTYRIETVLYRLSDSRLVWTAISATYDPESQSDVARSLSEKVIQRLNTVGMVSVWPTVHSRLSSARRM